MEFESGVRSYIKASATVIVSFPVDYKGNAAYAAPNARIYAGKAVSVRSMARWWRTRNTMWASIAR